VNAAIIQVHHALADIHSDNGLGMWCELPGYKTCMTWYAVPADRGIVMPIKINRVFVLLTYTTSEIHDSCFLFVEWIRLEHYSS